MKTLSPHLRRRIEAEELANIMRELQQLEGLTHDFLSPPKSLAGYYRKWLEKVGVIFLSVAISTIAIIVNYILFIRILHVQF